MTSNGFVFENDCFKITDFSREELASIGAQFLMRFIGYSAHPEVKDAVDNAPQELKTRVEKEVADYANELAELKEVQKNNGDVEIYLRQATFSPHGEFVLYVCVQKESFTQAKRILTELIE